jgi:hypothetical protein
MRPKDPAGDGYQKGGRSSAHLRRYQTTQKQVRNDVTTEKYGELGAITLIILRFKC